MTLTHLTLTYLFWICVSVVVYTYVGYGILLFLITRIKRLFVKKKEKTSLKKEDLPEITFLTAAYNEEDYVQQKMENIESLNYPKDKLKIVWVTDGSDDETNNILKDYPEVTVLFQPERMGKTAAINRAMRYVKSPITVFTDANTMINSESLMHIVQEFQDPKVGCVAGEKRVAAKNSTDVASNGEGAYWKYESKLKEWDYELNSTMGAAGELYAIRTELFEELPLSTLLDDFVLSMRIVAKGLKIAYCKDAFATENGSASLEEEEKRKVRIAAGGLQSIWRLRTLLNPFPHFVTTFQYVSHRVLRWSITPICLFALIPLNVYLVLTSTKFFLIYTIIWALQIIFYSAAMSMNILIKKDITNKLLYIPYYFIFMNFNVIRGFIFLAKRGKKQTGVWEKAKRA